MAAPVNYSNSDTDDMVKKNGFISGATKDSAILSICSNTHPFSISSTARKAEAEQSEDHLTHRRRMTDRLIHTPFGWS